MFKHVGSCITSAMLIPILCTQVYVARIPCLSKWCMLLSYLRVAAFMVKCVCVHVCACADAYTHFNPYRYWQIGCVCCAVYADSFSL
jgi:hypothetical protein